MASPNNKKINKNNELNSHHLRPKYTSNNLIHKILVYSANKINVELQAQHSALSLGRSCLFIKLTTNVRASEELLADTTQG
jgi:hypothetical protein